MQLHYCSKIVRTTILLFLLISLIFWGQPIKAAEAVVPRYYVKPDGSGDCYSWGSACTLQTALNKVTPGIQTQIWVMKGTYTPGAARTDTFQLKNGATLYGGFVGNETDVSNRNFLLNETILSGEIGVMGNSADNSYHVVTASGTDTSAVLDGFTISDGNSSSDGGGIYASSGSPILYNLKLIRNKAVGNGGGLYITNGVAVIYNVQFTENTASGNGGGMYAADNDPLSLIYATFSKNSATTGGGIYKEGGSMILAYITFQENIASFSSGGAYVDTVSGSIVNVTFDRNTAGVSAGGLDLVNSTSTLDNVTFSGNIADYGAGLGISAGAPTLLHLTLSGNHANNTGGGMYIFDSNSSLRESILWGNTAPSAPEVYLASNPDKAQFVNSVMEDGCPVGAEHCTGLLLTDPMLGSLGNYGGTTPTIPLLFGSSAIDVGNAADCSSSDQREVARPQEEACDLGAYEAREFKVSFSGVGQSAGVGLPFKAPLEISISSDYGDPVDGAKVVFSTPTSGPSATPATQTATLSGGVASVRFTANGVIGTYFVTAKIGVISLPLILFNGPLATISSSQNPSPTGGSVTLTIQVSVPAGTPTGVPTGTVSLSELASPDLPSTGLTLPDTQPLVNGKAVFNLSDLTIGAHTLVASYSGDANYPPTDSAAFVQEVDYLVFLPLTVR